MGVAPHILLGSKQGGSLSAFEVHSGLAHAVIELTIVMVCEGFGDPPVYN